MTNTYPIQVTGYQGQSHLYRGLVNDIVLKPSDPKTVLSVDFYDETYILRSFSKFSRLLKFRVLSNVTETAVNKKKRWR